MRSGFSHFRYVLILLLALQVSARQAIAESGGDNPPPTPPTPPAVDGAATPEPGDPGVVLRVPPEAGCRRLMALLVTGTALVVTYIATDGSMFGLFPSFTERRCKRLGGGFQQKSIPDANGHPVTAKLCFCPEGLELKEFMSKSETCAQMAARMQGSLQKVRDAVVDDINKNKNRPPASDKDKAPPTPIPPHQPEFKAPQPQNKGSDLPAGLQFDLPAQKGKSP